MHWWMWPFLFIGAFVTLGFVTVVYVEVDRTARQSLRIAYVVNRLRGNRGFTLRDWARAFRYELTARYDELELGHFRINRRLSVRIKPAA